MNGSIVEFEANRRIVQQMEVQEAERKCMQRMYGKAPSSIKRRPTIIKRTDQQCEALADMFLFSMEKVQKQLVKQFVTMFKNIDKESKKRLGE